MLGTSSLLAFSFRAFVLLLLVPLLWLTIARPYNEALVALSHNLLPDGVTLSVLGTHILIDYTPAAPPFSLDGLTLHSGLVLMTVLILAAVGWACCPASAGFWYSSPPDSCSTWSA